MLPSMETRFIWAAVSRARPEKLCFPVLLAIIFNLIVLFPPLRMLAVLDPSLLTCTTHVCIFSVVTRLNSAHRYILSKGSSNNSLDVTSSFSCYLGCVTWLPLVSEMLTLSSLGCFSTCAVLVTHKCSSKYIDWWVV